MHPATFPRRSHGNGTTPSRCESPESTWRASHHIPNPRSPAETPDQPPAASAAEDPQRQRRTSGTHGGGLPLPGLWSRGEAWGRATRAACLVGVSFYGDDTSEHARPFDVDGDTPWEPPLAGSETEALLGALERLRWTFRFKVGGLEPAWPVGHDRRFQPDPGRPAQAPRGPGGLRLRYQAQRPAPRTAVVGLGVGRQ